MSAVACVWDIRAALGEGPLWNAESGSLWFTDIKSDRIHCFSPGTGVRRSWDTPPRPGFLAPKAHGGFVVGLQAGLYDFDPDTGAFTHRLAVEPDRSGNRLNDGHVDAAGRLWFGSMDDAAKASTGALYLYDRGRLTLCDPGYVITNGPVVSPDGRTLYHTDTLARVVLAFDLAADGSLSNRRPFARPARGYPDGSAIDADGCVWVALYGGWGVDVFAPDGSLMAHHAVPCANVTKPAFGGDRLETLYLTTARQGLSSAELEAQPLAGGLFALDPGVCGLPQGRLAPEPVSLL